MILGSSMILCSGIGWCWRYPIACWRRALCRPPRRFAELGIGFPCSCLTILLILHLLQKRSKFAIWSRASSRAESHQASFNWCFRKLAGSIELLLTWLFNITWASQGCSVNDWCSPRALHLTLFVSLACFCAWMCLKKVAEHWITEMVPAPDFFKFFLYFWCTFEVLFKSFRVFCLFCSGNCICRTVPGFTALHRSRAGSAMRLVNEKKRSKRLVLISDWNNMK